MAHFIDSKRFGIAITEYHSAQEINPDTKISEEIRKIHYLDG
jgi:hypothetical protein